MIQRRLKIGYNRAARIVETMEKEGLIGPQGAAGKPREVYVDMIKRTGETRIEEKSRLRQRFSPPILLFTAQPAKTQDPSAVVSGIQKKYASINDLSSPFTQVTLIKDLDEKIASSGKVWFKNPG